MALRELHDDANVGLAVGSQAPEQPGLEDPVEATPQQTIVNGIGITTARVRFVLLPPHVGGDRGRLLDEPLLRRSLFHRVLHRANPDRITNPNGSWRLGRGSVSSAG